MRIIFSRKGFDSAAGGGASPLINGRPVSLPIPCGSAGSQRSITTYADLGLGAAAERASRGKVKASDFCHHDPMFRPDGTCLFGQCSAAQTHLVNQGVGIGDVFVFFGLFRAEDGSDPHHRIFAYQRIEEIIDLTRCDEVRRSDLAKLGHPHALAMHAKNDTIYVGEGRTARKAGSALRLTVPEGPPSLWSRPVWLKRGGLSYHDREDRWLRGGKLRSVARGQEFVADIGRRKEPLRWLDMILQEINR